MRKMLKNNRLGWEILALAICLVVFLPTFMVIVNSFKDVAGAADMSISLPKAWNIVDNYKTVYREANIPRAYWNTSVVTVLSVIGVVLFCSTSAYVIQRRDDRFIRVLRYVLLAGMILPLTIIPTFILFHKVHLTGNYWGVILLYIASSYPFITYVYSGFFDGISKEIDEAAAMDGAKGAGLFLRVIFPLLMPINATAVIISFMSFWNDFGTAIYFLSSPKLQTLGLTIYFFFGVHSSDWNYVFADLVLISLPVILLYVLLQRYIVSGLTSGAVKS
ncbi:carbohydrate ABC transporter permease [Cohnella endophytica]|uniref:Carbohydrate ABC transporter permease n=1 Tax=Cohnella endophytica TaxID=2419778 RepID=A0A494XJJ6_9BACL|nr:carbohydrate ABC transporter permease [Cohnella endophytica]RKP49942.1 carbohydrate ABC transporter permease [Cohnella endophytica]